MTRKAGQHGTDLMWCQVLVEGARCITRDRGKLRQGQLVGHLYPSQKWEYIAWWMIISIISFTQKNFHFQVWWNIPQKHSPPKSWVIWHQLNLKERDSCQADSRIAFLSFWDRRLPFFCWDGGYSIKRQESGRWYALICFDLLFFFRLIHSLFW